ncbi:MAG: hypothetical protein ACLTSZ_11580 [Lachnospiraceae bacterium]
MRTNEERSALIHRRIRELKRQQAKKKERLVDLSCVAGSLILILLLAMWIPDSLAHSEANYGTFCNDGQSDREACLFRLLHCDGDPFLPALGVCVTILLYHLHRHFRDRKEEQDEF